MWWIIGGIAATAAIILGLALAKTAARADQAALEAYHRHVEQIRTDTSRRLGWDTPIPAHLADEIEAGTFRPAFGVFVPTAEPEDAIEYCLCEHEFEDHDLFGACTVWDCLCTAWEDDGGERAERLAAEEG